MSFFSRLLDHLRGGTDGPEMRLSARMDAPLLIIELGGYGHRTRDWSAGGACIEGFAGEVEVGGILSGHLHWAGDKRRLAFTAEVMRREGNGVLALRWLDLPLAIQQEMEAIIG
ncbi:MAG: PilZ domain-containing protein [Parvibaculum sp.]|uniref:PilZ domain-containing protein n=1 Tax=Parvibaculum sp. TaxID=2024848 RepID=UPI002724F188|nr:PilZ domain-containing protein [Parvibaculum sp.]MDO8837974.1 PilZ domain-containing protein [Parvibaculum sp.]